MPMWVSIGHKWCFVVYNVLTQDKMLGISATHQLITNCFPKPWDNQIHFLINTWSAMQGHHRATQDCSSLTEPRGQTKVSAVSSYCPPIMAMTEGTVQIVQVRRPQKKLKGKHAAAWIVPGCTLPLRLPPRIIFVDRVWATEAHTPLMATSCCHLHCARKHSKTRLGFGLLSQDHASCALLPTPCSQNPQWLGF